MPSFDSPLGNKKFGNSNLREVDVSDESEFDQKNIVNPVVRRRESMPPLNEESIQSLQAKLREFEKSPDEIEREIKEARRAKITGKERLNEGAKKRLEILLNMTRVSHTANIDGNTFTFQPIPSKFMREAIMAASEYDGTVQSPFEIRRQFLARSIVQIADVDFEQFVGSNSLESKLALLDELDESILNRLYHEYLEMMKKSKEKYSIKTESDAKGVIDDLKK